MNQNFIIPIALFFFAFSLFSYNLDQMSYFGDEQNYWYPFSVKYMELMLNGDFFNECWKDYRFCIGDLDKLNADMNESYIGQALYPPQTPFILIVGTSFQIFGNDDSIFSFENLTAARLASPVLGALIVVFAFEIGKQIFNRFVGLSFSLLVLFHGLTVVYSRLIMLEIVSNFFLIFSFWLFIKAIKSKNINIKFLACSAFLCSLGIITKFYEVFALIPIFIILLIFRNEFKQQLQKTIVWKRFFSSSIPLSIFIVVIITGSFFMVQPFFWNEPIEQLSKLRNSAYGSYGTFKPPFSDGSKPPHINFIGIFSATIAPIADFYYYNFSDHIPQTGSIGKTVISNFSTIPLSGLFFIGIGFLIHDIRIKNFQFSKFIILVWYIFTFISLMLTIHTYNHDRYWIELFIPMMLIASFGAYRLTRNVRKFIQSSFLALFVIAHSVSILIYWELLYYNSTLRPECLLKACLGSPLPISIQESIDNPLVFLLGIIFCIFTCILLFKMQKYKKLKSVN